jgi:hypothetical protein
VDVAFRRPDAQTSGIVLSPSQQFSFNRVSGTSGVRPFDARSSSGWKDNLFVFDNEPLARVLKVMERQFGVRLVLADSASARRIIKAEFRNETVCSFYGSQTSVFVDVSNLFNTTNIQAYRYRFTSNGQPYREEIKLWPILPTFGLAVRF